MRLPFSTRARTAIEFQLNAALQPMHRGFLFADPIRQVLKRIAPGSRITDEGALIDDQAEVVRSDIRVEVTGDAREVLAYMTRTLESDYRAPRGSFAILGGEHHAFGAADGVAIRMTPPLPIDVFYEDVPANAALMERLVRVADLLRGHGQVSSWMLRETRTSVYIYGRSAPYMADIAVSVLSSGFPDAAVTWETVA